MDLTKETEATGAGHGVEQGDDELSRYATPLSHGTAIAESGVSFH